MVKAQKGNKVRQLGFRSWAAKSGSTSKGVRVAKGKATTPRLKGIKTASAWKALVSSDAMETIRQSADTRRNNRKKQRKKW